MYATQLDALVNKVESFVQSLRTAKIQSSKDQHETFKTLSQRLSDAATAIPVEIESMKKRWAESCKDGQRLIAQAQSVRSDIITADHLKNRGVFARNIRLFFRGPQDSFIDSDATKARKRLTRERCERICTLRPDEIISWAIAFPPSTWTANWMSSDTFNYVDEYIEPSHPVVWPSEIYDTLNALRDEDPLQGSQRYHKFLKGKL